MGLLKDKLKSMYGNSGSMSYFPPATPPEEKPVDPPRPSQIIPKRQKKPAATEKICRICGVQLTGRKRVLCDSCRVVAAKRHQDRKHERAREVSRNARVSTPCVICGTMIPVEDKVKSNIVTCSAECKRLNRNRQNSSNRRRKKEERREETERR